MYKVFIKDKPLFLVEDINSSTFEEGVKVLRYQNDLNVLKKALFELENDTNLKGIAISHNSLSELWDSFKSLYKIIEAAGGLVQSSKDEILLINRYGRWDLPKGKVEKKEAIEDAAIREVEEECNISGLKIVKRLDTTYHVYNQNNTDILKFSHWFQMKCSLTAFELRPQIEEGITEVKWATRKEVMDAMKNTYGTVKDLVTSFLGKVH